MDEIIAKLADIENRASDIMDEANGKKKELAAAMAEKTKEWDTALTQETDKEVASLREKMQASIQGQLSQQKKNAEGEILAMQNSYDKNHDRYVQQLFSQMTRE